MLFLSVAALILSKLAAALGYSDTARQPSSASACPFRSAAQRENSLFGSGGPRTQSAPPGWRAGSDRGRTLLPAWPPPPPATLKLKLGAPKSAAPRSGAPPYLDRNNQFVIPAFLLWGLIAISIGSATSLEAKPVLYYKEPSSFKTCSYIMQYLVNSSVRTTHSHKSLQQSL